MSRHSQLTVRCPNCLSKIPVQKNSAEAVCGKCGIGYRICWPSPSQPMIRGLLAPISPRESE
ncbi:MAG: hypothetical protein ACXQTF_03310 [Candidatus Hecatellaceae archaeon]|nr:MAG: hypothetical protein DRO43_00290 [Candidatus Hecatellales archaeon]